MEKESTNNLSLGAVFSGKNRAEDIAVNVKCQHSALIIEILLDKKKLYFKFLYKRHMKMPV